MSRFKRKKTPLHYATRGIRHCSPSKINKPFWYVVAEYGYRQQRYYAAVEAQKQRDPDGNPLDPEADLRVQHYYTPFPFKPRAGTSVAEAAFQIINGDDRSDAVAHALGKLHEYDADKCGDHDIVNYNLDGNGEHVISCINNTVAGLQEAFAGANQIETEERVEIELRGIDVPVLGFSDGRGGGVVAELKTKWDSRDAKSKSGFKINSVPSKPRSEDILQVAVYQRQHGGIAKLVYANRLNHRVFEIPQDQLDEAIDKAIVICKARQRILERTETAQEILAEQEPDWGHWLLSEWSPELKLELKDVCAGN